MKKILSMALAVIIAAGSVTAYAVEVESEGTAAMADGAGDSFIEGYLQYTVLDDGTLEVSCPGENTYKLTEITIPSAVNGKSVTSIGNRAFIDCRYLTSVTIPDSVTSIGDLSFYDCEGLTTVTIPDSVTSIGDDVFRNCKSLTSVTIPNGVTSISGSAFDGCESLASVTIPDSVTSIGTWAFGSCESLTSVTIPDSVTSIGAQAFYGCKSLTSVTIPDGVTSIGDQAFYWCTSLTAINVGKENKDYCSENGVLFDKDKKTLITYPAGKTDNSYAIPDGVRWIEHFAFTGCTNLTSVTIPNSVTMIMSRAFTGCTSLTSVTIPDSVRSIGDYAFGGCPSLTSVTIPSSVTSISNDAFFGCASLTAINVEKENKNYCSENGVLFNKNKTKLIRYPAGKTDTSYAIPDSITSIDEFLFYGCTNLVSVTIPDSVTSIGGWAFRGCTSLTTITIPGSVTSIDNETFDGCTSLKTVTILNGVTSIGNNAFINCESLTTVTIPDSVTSIDNGVFYGCISLTAINVGKGNNNYCSENGVLFNKDKTTLIRYPAGKTGNSYAIPESVTSINSSAFNGCTSLVSVTIPDGITSIGDFTFDGCESLASVTIPDSVANISFGAFDGCVKLKDIYYSGTEEEWGKIRISIHNEPLKTATIHYNSIGPDAVQIDIAKPESGNAPDTSGMKVEIGGGEKPQTITISADGKLDLSGMADGKYSFTFSANNCAPRKYSVTVLNGTASGLDGGVELHLYGDISGDGKITNSDVLKANASARKTTLLEGYDLSVADINGDGKITNADVLKMNAHARKTTSIW